MGTFFKSDEVTILRNPSAARLRALISNSGYRCLRGVIDEEGDLYVWDANHMVHSDLYFDFGITGLRVDIAEHAVGVVLAGGAHELMVPQEELDGFFEEHGHPGATLDDVDVIASICDEACSKVRNHRSLAGREAASVTADIDPRLPHGERNLRRIGEMLEALAERSASRRRG